MQTSHYDKIGDEKNYFYYYYYECDSFFFLSCKIMDDRII